VFALLCALLTDFVTYLKCVRSVNLFHVIETVKSVFVSYAAISDLLSSFWCHSFDINSGILFVKKNANPSSTKVLQGIWRQECVEDLM